MLNAGRRKLVGDTQRYVLSMGQGMSSCSGLKVCKVDFLQTSWSKVGLNTSPVKPALGQKVQMVNMQCSSTTQHKGASRV